MYKEGNHFGINAAFLHQVSINTLHIAALARQRERAPFPFLFQRGSLKLNPVVIPAVQRTDGILKPHIEKGAEKINRGSFVAGVMVIKDMSAKLDAVVRRPQPFRAAPLIFFALCVQNAFDFRVRGLIDFFFRKRYEF
ncbi:hypothetical protein ACRQU7_12735 [Caproiciproducens sp. R1]|uniref:hypothetical protein n=1 Tax=Caproiciproducens sp. R1 TaxID=3435000 RepID=UPI0040343B99